MRQSFVFHREWRDALSGSPQEVKLEVYEAIIEYATTGTLTDLKPMAMLAFNFIRETIDRDNAAYELILQRNRENGKKGGRPAKPKETQGNPMEPKETQQNPKNPVGFEEKENEEQENLPPTPPIKEKERKEKEDLPPLYRAGTPSQTMEARREKFYTSLIAYTEQYGKQMVRDFYNYWTEPNRSLTKMRFEMQPTWSTPHRLATWFRKQQQINQRDAVNNRYPTAEERAADAASIVAKFLRSE